MVCQRVIGIVAGSGCQSVEGFPPKVSGKTPKSRIRLWLGDADGRGDAWLFLAMSQQRTGHGEEARQNLAKFDDWCNSQELSTWQDERAGNCSANRPEPPSSP